MTSRERVLRALRGEPWDRPAVVCPGGMMSMAVTEVMDRCGCAWPEAHVDEKAMAGLALAMQESAGFDNLAVPFCMTVEAAAYGACVNLGSRTEQPRVRGWILPPDASASLTNPDFTTGRAGVLLAALRTLREGRPDLALFGNVAGPLSVLGMLADPLRMLRWTRRCPDRLHAYLDKITDGLAAFGLRQIEAGADVICVADPTATGEILGGPLFAAFALPYLVRLVKAWQSAGAAVVVHICGDVRAIVDELRPLPAEALSFDAMVDLVGLQSQRPPWRVMGNLGCFMLESGPRERIIGQARRLAAGGVTLLAPACGIVPTTPVAHLAAMRDAVNGR